MRTTRIAAIAVAAVLALSSIALANGSDDIPTAADDSSPGVMLSAESSTPTAPATVHSTVGASTGATILASNSASTSLSSSTSTPSSTPTPSSTSTPGQSTTTIDDRTSTTTRSTTSTTIDDSSSRDDDTRAIVSLELRTYTVGEAGTVTVEGMHLIAVDANAGWTVEVDEASADRIKVEFEQGETDAEFELRADGELRIRTHD